MLCGLSYESYLNARVKYDEYALYLSESKAFRDEWQAIKAAFPEETKQEKIIRRSFICASPPVYQYQISRQRNLKGFCKLASAGPNPLSQQPCQREGAVGRRRS